MASIWNMLRHRYFGAAATVAMLIMLPVALFISQQPQDSRGLAEDATVLSFFPLSSPPVPIMQKVGDEFNLSLMLEPKDKIITKVELEVTYDPQIIQLSKTNPIRVNSKYYPEIIEGPIYTDGKIRIVLSKGTELTNKIDEITKILTLNFTAVSPAKMSKISFSKNTAVYNITAENSDGENVLSTTIPAYLSVE